MSARNILMSASGVGNDKLYVDDVFSTYLYTGNGSTQTINNGIDLAGKGGLVWIKSRSQAGFSNVLVDTQRGSTQALFSNDTQAEFPLINGVTSFSSSGFNLGSVQGTNQSGGSIVSWTFRKATKFFDVVTYTGDGLAARAIPHNLGIEPGFTVVKRTDNTSNWVAKHRSAGDCFYLNTANNPGSLFGVGSFNATTFTVHTDAAVGNTKGSCNDSGATYVAYLFAHDTGIDGIIQCGSFTTDAGCNATVTLGWEPQFVIVKNRSGNGAWFIVDSMRGLPSEPSTSPRLAANFTDAEFTTASTVWPSATGFYTNNNSTSLASNATYIYLAIRRPNKPPTSGTQVYNAIARTGTGGAATVTGVGFAPDLVISKARENAVSGGYTFDRLRGTNRGLPMSNPGSGAEEVLTDALEAWRGDGVILGVDTGYTINKSPYRWVNYFFKRAVGVFDQVCYTGTGSARTEVHGLSVAPELIIVKARNAGNNWAVYHASLSQDLLLNSSAPTRNPAFEQLFQRTHSATSFGVTSQSETNAFTTTYVAYLFATKVGISKVGSYTGNGSSQTINCGFTTGARFVLIKRTGSTGDWYVWSTVRGIVSANDPHLSLNTVAAEVTTDDSVDPNTTGFVVNQVDATNINVNGATYIYLAFA